MRRRVRGVSSSGARQLSVAGVFTEREVRVSASAAPLRCAFFTKTRRSFEKPALRGGGWSRQRARGVSRRSRTGSPRQPVQQRRQGRLQPRQQSPRRLLGQARGQGRHPPRRQEAHPPPTPQTPRLIRLVLLMLAIAKTQQQRPSRRRPIAKPIALPTRAVCTRRAHSAGHEAVQALISTSLSVLRSKGASKGRGSASKSGDDGRRATGRRAIQHPRSAPSAHLWRQNPLAEAKRVYLSCSITVLRRCEPSGCAWRVGPSLCLKWELSLKFSSNSSRRRC